jgi:hypothetical protein
MSWQIARCSKARYCDFTLVHEDAGAKVECCIYCGRKEIYRKVNGRTDNIKYLKMHIRNFAQPYGASRKVFEEIYGKQKLTNFDRDLDKARWRPTKNERREQKRKEALEFYNTLGQSSR